MDVVALMLLESTCGGDPAKFHLYEVNTHSSSSPEANTPSISEIDGTENPTKTTSQTNKVEVVTPGGSSKKDSNEAKPEKAQPSSEDGQVCTLEPGQYLECGIGPGQNGSKRTLSAKTVERWKLATKAMRGRPNIYQNGPLDLNNNLLSEYSNNWVDSTLTMNGAKRFHKDYAHTPVFYILYLFLPLIYGGIHLSAWSFNFPTFVEHVMWKASSIIIMAGTFALLFMFFIPLGITSILESMDVINSCQEEISDERSMTCIFFCIAPLYIASRIFLLVESFISVRHLPIGVYLTVQWSDYIPHL